MTTHKLFRLGKACVGLGALTAPVPLITCAIDGRAGITGLLPVVPMAAALVLLGTHGTNAADCDGCMTDVVNALASNGVGRIGIEDQADTFDLNQAA